MVDPVITEDPSKVIPTVIDPNTPKDPLKVDEPVKEVDEPKKKEDKSKELDTTVWGDTGDDIGNSVLQVLQDSGVMPDKAKALLYDAVQAGDPTKIDRDALIEAVGKSNANLIMAGVDNFVAKQKAAHAEVFSILYEEVGSKENWDTMVTWAKANLTETEINDYIAMVDQGGRKARMAAKDMRERYEEAGNTSLKKDETVVPGSGNKTTTTAQPLSRAEYYKEMDALNRSGKITDAASKALWARREAGKKQGI